MHWLFSVYVAFLFFILTPAILVRLPPKGGKFTVAGFHAVVFALVLHFTGKMVWNFSRSLEGFHEGARGAQFSTSAPSATPPSPTTPSATTNSSICTSNMKSQWAGVDGDTNKGTCTGTGDYISSLKNTCVGDKKRWDPKTNSCTFS